jgi:hypothetical protein
MDRVAGKADGQGDFGEELFDLNLDFVGVSMES